MYLGSRQNDLPEQPFFTALISHARHMPKTSKTTRFIASYSILISYQALSKLYSIGFGVGWLVLWIKLKSLFR
jgi:hypothetical protein